MNDHTLYRTSYDNSMVEAFCRCERRHYFNYVRCIVPERTGLALSFGSAWHEAMDSMWRNWDVEASYQAFLSLWPQEIDETTAYPRTPGRAKEMLFEYKKRFQEISLRDYKVLGIERGFRVPLSPDAAYPFYTGRLDKILQCIPDGKIIICDHKTAASFERGWKDSFSPNSQMDGYAFAGVMTYGDDFYGIVIDGALTQKTKLDFLRLPIIKDSMYINAWLIETQQRIDSILTNIQRLQKGEYCFPKRTVACSDYGGCPFLYICRQWPYPWEKPGIPFGYRQDDWDPLKDNEEKERKWDVQI